MSTFPEAIAHDPTADNFDFKSSLESIRYSIVGHLFVVIGVTILCVVMTLTYIMVWPPVFEAAVTIAADSDEDLNRSAFYQQWNIFRRESIGDEAVLMTSDPVLKKVITRLDLKYEEVYHPFMSHVIHLWGESFVGRNYRKIKYTIFPRPPLPAGLTEEMLEKGKILKDFRAGVGLTSVGEANVALITVRGPTPDVASQANAVMDVYLEERRARYVREAELATQALARETEKAQRKLIAIEQTMQRFYAENSLLLVYEKDRLRLQQWLDLETEIMDLRSHEAQLMETLEILQRRLSAEETALTDASTYHDNVLELKAQYTQLEIAIRQKAQLFRDDAPEVDEMRRQLDALRGVIDEQEQLLASQANKSPNVLYDTTRSQIAQTESDLVGTRASVTAKQALYDQLGPAMAELPQKMQRTSELQREQVLAEGQYKALSEKLVQATVSATTATSAPSAIRIIDRATPPDKPRWPSTKFMLAGSLIVGVILGVVCALLLDLIFVRATRYKLNNDRRPVLATFEQDEQFLRKMYALDHQVVT
ncbi:MAG: GNVR domain-containing protein [Pseudomonadota bacterium]